jgi:hypothetical protein
LAFFTFFDDVLIIFLLIMIATWAIAGAIYRIAVGAQDCVLRPKDGVLSQKYANRRSGFFKQAFHRIQESSDFSRRQNQGIIVGPSKRRLRPKLCEPAANRQIFGLAKK